MIDPRMQTVALALTFVALCAAVAGTLYICHLQDDIAASGTPAIISNADSAEVPTACPLDATVTPEAAGGVSAAADKRIAASDQSPS